MISAFAPKITHGLCNAHVIDADENELYRYGFFILLSHIFFCIEAFSFGILFGVTWESILFYVLFTLLRSYAGGVYARTEKACTILTTLTMFACVVAIRLLEEFPKESIALSLLAVGAVFVFTLCPLDTKEKPLEPDERKHYRKITQVIAILYVIVALFAYYTGHSGVLCSTSISVFVESVLLIVGRVLKKLHEIPAIPESSFKNFNS